MQFDGTVSMMSDLPVELNRLMTRLFVTNPGKYDEIFLDHIDRQGGFQMRHLGHMIVAGESGTWMLKVITSE